jgi:6-phosphogluconolactonase (cycloisomerase 2 family)
MTRRQLLIVSLSGVVALVLAIVFAAPGHRVEIAGLDGTVYLETNSRAPDSNEVLAFHFTDGSLRPIKVDRYNTRGSGSHDLDNRGVLDSDQEIVTNSKRTLLFAVNASSDTIAVFHIKRNGKLKAVKGSPFPSNGKAPASLGLVRDHILVVANKAQDGIRPLSKTPANYSTFQVSDSGQLSSPISSIDVPPKSSPLQVYVTPNQKVVISSEESGVFRAFRVTPDGRLEQGPNSPLGLVSEAFPHNRVRTNNWPAGLVSHPTQKILYAQIANSNRTIVYRWDDDARLTFVRSMNNPNTYLPCWTEVNAKGTRMYSGNAGSNNMTVYDISKHPAKPKYMQTAKLDGVGNPWNFTIDPSGKLLFMLVMRAVKEVPSNEGNELHALRIKKNGTLAELDSSPIKIPLHGASNPYGIAVVPRP